MVRLSYWSSVSSKSIKSQINFVKYVFCHFQTLLLLLNVFKVYGYYTVRSLSVSDKNKLKELLKMEFLEFKC